MPDLQSHATCTWPQTLCRKVEQIGCVADQEDAECPAGSSAYFPDPFAAVQYHSAAMSSRKASSSGQPAARAPAQSRTSELSWDDIGPLPSDTFAQPSTALPSWNDSELEADAAFLADMPTNEEAALEGPSMCAAEKPATSNSRRPRRYSSHVKWHAHVLLLYCAMDSRPALADSLQGGHAAHASQQACQGSEVAMLPFGSSVTLAIEIC